VTGGFDIPAHFREQAGWCRALGSPLTADLCLAFAEDFEAGGPVYALASDWPTNPRKDALALRLAGYLHHAVLTGDAPALADAYPARNPAWTLSEIWPLARDWIAAHTDDVRAFLASPPQTNETRRSIALLPGFLDLAARYNKPMHLLELGASAGLNQNWDRYGYETESWTRPGSSPVTVKTAWDAPVPEHLGANPRVVSRAACDLSPINLHDPAEAIRLKSYTWADQTERLKRLDAAIELARETNITVEQAEASAWLARKLADRPSGALTVIFHSVFLIYPPREAIAAIMSMIAEAGEAASEESPLAWLCYESEALFGGDNTSPKMYTRLQSWPGGEIRLLNKSDGHVTRVVAV